MLIKRNWHDFNKGEILLWSFYGEDRLVEVVDTGVNSVSVLFVGDEAKQPHPVRFWEKDLETLHRIKKKGD